MDKPNINKQTTPKNACNCDNMKMAIDMFVNRLRKTMRIGDELGFGIRRKHFKIIRDL